MTNAELIAKIRAEIERLKNHAISSRAEFIHIGYTENAFVEDSRITVYDHLLSFLANIEKSLPINSELRDARRTEEAYQEVAKEMRKQIKDGEVLEEEINRTYHDGSVADTSDIDHVTYENIAEHFYDLGCRRTAEKYDELEYNRQRASGSSEIPKDLEEASSKFATHTVSNGVSIEFLYEKLSFQEGAKWQREQDRLEIANIKAKLWQDGFDDCKEQMMSEAVECETACIKDRLLAVLPMKEFRWTVGDKVRIIVIPNTDEK